MPEARVSCHVSRVAFRRMAFINEGLAPCHVGSVFPPCLHIPVTLGMHTSVPFPIEVGSEIVSF